MDTEKNLRALFTKRWHVRELDTYSDSPVYGEWVLGVYSVQVYGATSGGPGKYEARFYAEGAAPLAEFVADDPVSAVKGLFTQSGFISEMAGVRA